MGIFTGFLKKTLLCVMNRSSSLKPMVPGHIFSLFVCFSANDFVDLESNRGLTLSSVPYKVEDNETLRDFHTVFEFMFSSSMLVQINKIILMDFFLI